MAAFKFKRGEFIRVPVTISPTARPLYVRRTYTSGSTAYYLLDNGSQLFEMERELIESDYVLVPQESES
jgi:hypothetical protein